MLLNVSNHPFETWGYDQQEEALKRWDNVVDMPFPLVDPNWDEIALQQFVKRNLEEIVKLKPHAVHIMGEMNFTFQMVYFLMQQRIPCYASTTERLMEMRGEQKISQFKFVHFRKYQFVDQISEVKNSSSVISLTEAQNTIFSAFKDFIKPSNPNKVFILRGYAGTGKTTLLKFFYDYIISSEEYKAVVATPTNKAARVIGEKIQGVQHKGVVTTIHGLIYSFDKVQATEEKAWIGGEGQIYSNFVLKSKLKSLNDLFDHFADPEVERELIPIFMFDESSMISSHQQETYLVTKFGTGSILNDLFSCFGREEKFIFVGDPCQCPPPNGERDPSALSADYFRRVLQLPTEEYELNEVMRQGKDSGILDMATELRNKIMGLRVEKWPKLKMKASSTDIILSKSMNDMVDTFLEYQEKYGVDNCFCVSVSNPRVQAFNKAVKEKLSGDMNLKVGDVLINYVQNYLHSIENGERLVVQGFGNEVVHKAGLKYVKLTVRVLGTNEDKECYLLQDFLTSSAAQMTAIETKSLMIDFDKRMKEAQVPRNSLQYKMEQRSDPFLNALKAKYGYSGTIHKAQGSEWDYVFLNLSGSDFAMAKDNYERAESVAKVIYTGITRAKYKLFVSDGFWMKMR
jgi:hypothetical protein